MQNDRLTEFAKWSRHAPKTVVIPLLGAISRAANLSVSEQAVYIRATADLLNVSNLPETLVKPSQTPPPDEPQPKRMRKIFDSDTEPDTNTDVDEVSESDEDQGFSLTPHENFIPGKFYTMPTQIASDPTKTETSYFLADTEDEVTWLYTHKQLADVFDADDIPLQRHEHELFLSDHTEKLSIPPGVKATCIEILRTEDSSIPYIGGVCRTAAPPCIMAFTNRVHNTSELIRTQADDYIKILLSRGSNGSKHLAKAIKATPKFTCLPERSTRKQTCSACGLKRHIKCSVMLGQPPERYRLGSFCLQRIKLAWEMTHAPNTTKLMQLCSSFKNRVV